MRRLLFSANVGVSLPAARPLAERYQYRRNGSRPVPQGRGLVPRPRGFSDVARQSERRLVDRLPRGGRRGHLLLHRRGGGSPAPARAVSGQILPWGAPPPEFENGRERIPARPPF